MYCQRNVIKSVKCKQSLKCSLSSLLRSILLVFIDVQQALFQKLLYEAQSMFYYNEKVFIFYCFSFLFQTPFGQRKKYICIVIHKTT
jgi:hypothetical protein